MTTSLCVKAIKRQFERDHIVLEQVRALGENHKTRIADALAVGLWPSRGFLVQGFEVKVLRADLLRELRDPEKSDPIQKHCDHWWLVAPPDVARVEDLPATWGLFELRSGKLKVIRKAPKLAAEPFSRSFLSAVLRRHTNGTEARIAQARRETLAEAERRYAAGSAPDLLARLERAENNEKELKELLDKFERESGINVRYKWALGDVGEGLRMLSRMESGDYFKSMKRLHEQESERLRVTKKILTETEAWFEQWKKP